MTRLFPILTLLLAILIFPTTSYADEPEFGKYGYRHGDLHLRGTIQQLMDVTGKTCCDGGLGGECRVTEIRWQSPKPLFRYGNVWCPLNTQVNFVDLPENAAAVVCASSSETVVDGDKVCPSSTYCAGVEGGV